MINLAEPIRFTIGFEIDDEAAAQAVLNLDHVTDHDTVLALDNALGQSSHLLIVFVPVLASILEKLDSVGFSGLFLESNGEDYVLHRLQKFSQSRHVHSNFTIVVLCAVHGLEQLFTHLHCVTVLIADGDHVGDVEHSHIASHGQILVHGKLCQVPFRSTPMLELLSD